MENEINKLNEETIFIFYIDEFPWLNTKGNNFVEDFGVFWNSINFNKKIKVIITGSAVSWLNKNVFRSKGGLYHKTTLKIQLKAFDVLEVKEFLNLKKNIVTTNDVLSYYMITGGIARYLNQLDFSLPIYENGFNLHSNNNILDFFNNSFSLKNNIHYLIISLFKERIKLNITDIKKSTSLKNFSPNTIYSALEELVETDILLKVNERKKQILQVMFYVILFYSFP